MLRAQDMSEQVVMTLRTGTMAVDIHVGTDVETIQVIIQALKSY